MIPEIGHYALVLALALALVQSVLPLWGARRGDQALMAVGPSVALAQLVFVLVAFLMLMTAYLQSDFSVVNVLGELAIRPSRSSTRVSGVWGNHEGSMLLWVLILALFRRPGRVRRAICPDDPARHRAVGAGMIRRSSAVHPGDLQPLPARSSSPRRGHAISTRSAGCRASRCIPPLLYLGYVGFSMAFSFAVAALIEGRVDAAWARWVRPWTLAAWMLPDRSASRWALLGLLRARLGRLVVLGPGRERRRSCRGSPARRCCIRRSSWRSATR